MSKINGTDNSFREKFKDRMENIGKDGVFGIVRKTENPININDNAIGEWNILYNNNIAKSEVNKSPNAQTIEKLRNDQTKSIHKSKMSNNGNMIMTTNPTMINNPNFNNNNNMPVPMMGGMGNPSQMYYMNPYVGYPPMVQPMMNYNYMGSPVPMYYNPHQMPNISPLNNYNRNLGVNTNYPPNSIPLAHYNTNLAAPVKLVGNNSTNTADMQSQSGQRLQRSISSKGSRLDNSNSYNQHIVNEPSYRPNKMNEGPFTNPESFSKIRGYSSNANSNYDNSYKPYSLKDYKDMNSAKLVLGGLGANVGTKEWVEKQEKMKKMEDYAKNVKGKPIFKYVKDTPTELIEKKKKEKIETSNRFKSYEYAKLIRDKPRSSLYSNGNNLGLDLEDQVNNYKSISNEDNQSNTSRHSNRIEVKNNSIKNLNSHPNEQNINRRYIEDNSSTRDNIAEQNSDNYTRGDIFYSKSRLTEDYKKDDLEFLKIQKQREVLNLKLNEIKESLLK